LYYTLLTGASSGIGFELAHEFAKHQHNLILVARSTQILEDLKTSIEDKYKVVARVISLDLAQPDSADQLYKMVQDQNLSVDILVNNAGFGDHGLFAKSELKRDEDMIVLNTLTLTKLTHLFLQDMLKRKSGRVLNVASIAGFLPGPLMTVYYATKAFVLSFSEGLYEELKGTGVTVTALCPGPTRSGFMIAAGVDTQEISALGKINIPTSQEVAEFGYKELMQGNAIAVHGGINILVAMTIGFFPRSLARKIVMKLQQKRLPQA
jgi:uncharacterized protein